MEEGDGSGDGEVGARDCPRQQQRGSSLALPGSSRQVSVGVSFADEKLLLCLSDVAHEKCGACFAKTFAACLHFCLHVVELDKNSSVFSFDRAYEKAADPNPIGQKMTLESCCRNWKRREDLVIFILSPLLFTPCCPHVCNPPARPPSLLSSPTTVSGYPSREIYLGCLVTHLNIILFLMS